MKSSNGEGSESLGACGKVYLQSEREGALRAVKKLKKDLYKEKGMDYMREILAMAEVSKVILESPMRLLWGGAYDYSTKPTLYNRLGGIRTSRLSLLRWNMPSTEI